MSLVAISTSFWEIFGKNKLLIQKFEPSLNQWIEIEKDTPQKFYLCIAVLDNQLIFSALGKPLTYSRYDICSRQWLSMSQIPKADNEKTCIANVSHCTYQGHLYAFGGVYGNNQSCARVVRWDPKTDTWKRLSDMKYARQLCSVAVYEERLYAAGGCDGQKYHTTTECYDVSADKWKRCADMNEGRIGMGMLEYNNQLYTVGGAKNRETLDTVECYDHKSNKWSKLSSLSLKRCYVSLVNYEQHLWAVSGRHILGSGFNIIEQYDVERDVWNRVQPLKRFAEVKCYVLPKNLVDCLFS